MNGAKWFLVFTFVWGASVFSGAPAQADQCFPVGQRQTLCCEAGEIPLFMPAAIGQPGGWVCYNPKPVQCMSLDCTCASFPPLDLPSFCCDPHGHMDKACPKTKASGCGHADVNADRSVDGADLGLVLGAWGEVNEQTALYDVDFDGVIGEGDVDMVINCWS